MNINSRVKRKSFFFNFALANGHFMSRPVFHSGQSLIGEIIHSFERHKPRFAWIQFLFTQRDYNHLLMYTKAELENYVQHANTTEYDEGTRQKIPRKEINTQWYKLAPPRIKKIEQILPKQTVLFEINGMWVSNQSNSTNGIRQLQELPLSQCSDEVDRLKAFKYKSPGILKMLVERNMITDISPSIYRYSGSREEPPCLIFTSNEIPYYIHMPTGASAKGLSSIRPAAHFPVGGTLKAKELMSIDGTGSSEDVLGKEGSAMSSKLEPRARLSRDQSLQDLMIYKPATTVARLRKIPTLEQPLEEEEERRLSQIISRNVRTFEIIYESKEDLRKSSDEEVVTTMLLSSSCETSKDDLTNVYIPQLESIYGKLDYENLSDKRPRFVVEDFPQIIKGLAIKPDDLVGKIA